VILDDALKISFTRDRSLIARVLDMIRERLVALPYCQLHTLLAGGGAGLSGRFQRAGHILGSAYVECDVRDGEADERIGFSGDLGAPHSPFLPEPVPPQRADRLVIESTYGARDQEGRETRQHRLQAKLYRALGDGSAVLIPASSIGRTQELLYEIEGIIHEQGWDRLEIVLDSPLAASFTQIYRQLRPF